DRSERILTLIDSAWISWGRNLRSCSAESVAVPITSITSFCVAGFERLSLSSFLTFEILCLAAIIAAISGTTAMTIGMLKLARTKPRAADEATPAQPYEVTVPVNEERT